MDQIRASLISQLAEKRSNMTSTTKSTDGTSKRGPAMLDLIRETGYVQTRLFNDMTEFEIQCNPGDLLDDLN